MSKGTVTKVAGIIGLACILAGSGYFVLKPDTDKRPEARQIAELGGLRLGMSPTEVTLALGKPAASSGLQTDDGGNSHLTYVYTKDHNDDYALNITFHGSKQSGARATVICEKGSFSNLLGFDKFSQEQDLARVLGPASYSSVRGDGLEKIVSYASWNASFKIALGKVVELCIHQGNFISYDDELPAAAQVPAWHVNP
jgi:hypothetical protein